jgi:glucose/arabinose dehydrogenase
MPRPVIHGAPLACLCLLKACSKGNPPTPSPPGSGAGETITGRERIGWDQQAASSAELATFRYAIYVDGSRSEMADVTCAASAGAAGFPCSGRLPPMSNGTHVLELASFIIDAGGVLESARSASLRVTVTGIGPGAAAALADGEIVTTADGVRLRAETLFEGLTKPTAVAVTADGRVFVGTNAGFVVLKDGMALGPAQLTDGLVMAIALSPTFERDGYFYVTQAVPAESGGFRFRTARYRDFGAHVGGRMVLLESGPAAATPSAAVRLGPDGKLYVAFDDGGSAAAAERMSEWAGKVLRLELDGRTPEDQAAASPVLFVGLTSPRGFDWTLDGSAIWVADASRDGIERLRVITTTSERPRRAGQRATFTMPRGLGAAALEIYRGDAIRELSGDLLVAGRDGGYILRVRFDPQDRARPMSTERLLEGRVGAVRALAVGPDGAIYFCTDTSLVKLVKAGYGRAQP